MRVTVFGIGYVGLVQAATLAEVGHEVLCVDVDPAKVEDLRQGIVPIYEPGLERLVRENAAEGRLNFTSNAAEGVDFASVQIIAVGTPPGEDGSADMKYVVAVAETIGKLMVEPKTVITKSTVPVGTGDRIVAAILQVLRGRQRSDLSVSVVSNPEFLKEGSAVSDCLKPDRIIVGSSDNEAIALMRELYAPFNRNHDKIIIMDRRSAEFTKYAANCMLASRISFMNEMANLAERMDADIEHVRHGIGSDPRIGYHFIYPGIGYGGSCFPKDVSAMIHSAEEIGYEPMILRAIEARNRAQKSVLVEKVQCHFGDDLAGRCFALWGLAFKANTDDMREASSRVIIEALWAAGATVQAFDPVAMSQCQDLYGHRDDLTLCGTKEAALRGADALLIATEWKNFRAPSFKLIKDTLLTPIIFDGRNLYEPEVVARYGIQYISIGRRVSGSVAGEMTRDTSETENR